MQPHPHTHHAQTLKFLLLVNGNLRHINAQLLLEAFSSSVLADVVCMRWFLCLTSAALKLLGALLRLLIGPGGAKHVKEALFCRVIWIAMTALDGFKQTLFTPGLLELFGHRKHQPLADFYFSCTHAINVWQTFRA